MFELKKLLGLILLICSCVAYGGWLPSGAYLLPGQTIYSANNRYHVTLQTDGNFVLYRDDGAVRFATYQFSGSFVTMQSDGNLVEYNSSNMPLWHISTYGNPGAWLNVQDDGNLVVYSFANVPLWNIGADQTGTALTESPSQVGDVVARDLDSPIIGALGHLGIWTGSNVAEVVNIAGNAVRYVSWPTFRQTTKPWPIARPSIPYFTVNECWEAVCNYYGPGLPLPVTGRMAIASRARQIYLIGADYTTFGNYKQAIPGSSTFLPSRGLYRCDTFVLDAFQATVARWGNPPQAWRDRMARLLSLPYTPTNVWEALKN